MVSSEAKNSLNHALQSCNPNSKNRWKFKKERIQVDPDLKIY